MPGYRVVGSELVQSLWSGYGKLLRVQLSGTDARSVILKQVRLPQPAGHPRGWHSNLSHQRKLKSYQVECQWYELYADKCDDHCPVPQCLGVQQNTSEILLLMSDLAGGGFPELATRVSSRQVDACLQWLANFHGRFLNHSHDGLWQCGTYWHLATRPDELAALDDDRLKRAAPIIDQLLTQCAYQTLVHGDAKLANFCFSGEQKMLRVAAVDFQYVGRGCGMKDLIYFLGSCLSDSECEQLAGALVDRYFEWLSAAITRYHPQIDAEQVVREWQSLYAVAWADFNRFLAGWSPGHWKLGSYSHRLTSGVVQRLLI